jgi:hypothetical protein
LTETDASKAFHPFYVFQIASLILWSLDEYYYYAAAIFLISVFSITTTVVETRSVGASERSTPLLLMEFADDAPLKGNFTFRLRRSRPSQRLL